MNIEEFRDYCLSKHCAVECTPFDDVTIVFKVCEKMFAFIGTDNPERGALLKCEPDYAVELRDQYPDTILPGYHMNKRHWNTVKIDFLSDSLVRQLVDHSYEQVVAKLTNKNRELLKNCL